MLFRSNALRYGAAARPQVTVAIKQGDGGGVVLSVADNGPGMTMQEAERLRERWALGAAGQKLGQGAGLGLAIVSRYAQLLGAHLSLEAASSGQGLVATVTFP